MESCVLRWLEDDWPPSSSFRVTVVEVVVVCMPGANLLRQLLFSPDDGLIMCKFFLDFLMAG